MSCTSQQIFRRKDISKTWSSIISGKGVCKSVRVQQIPQTSRILHVLPLVTNKEAFQNATHVNKVILALSVKSTYVFSQVWTLSVWGGPPSPQTEPQLHHCRETEEDPRCAERPFQENCAVTGSKLPHKKAFNFAHKKKRKECLKSSFVLRMVNVFIYCLPNNVFEDNSSSSTPLT